MRQSAVLCCTIGSTTTKLSPPPFSTRHQTAKRTLRSVVSRSCVCIYVCVYLCVCVCCSSLLFAFPCCIYTFFASFVSLDLFFPGGGFFLFLLLVSSADHTRHPQPRWRCVCVRRCECGRRTLCRVHVGHHSFQCAAALVKVRLPSPPCCAACVCVGRWREREGGSVCMCVLVWQTKVKLLLLLFNSQLCHFSLLADANHCFACVLVFRGFTAMC